MLLRSREQDETIKRTDVTRKNSLGRVLAEGAILQALQNSRNRVRTKSLYKAAGFAVPDLRESTFRSHLHRMKARKLIESISQGMWQIAKDAAKATPAKSKALA
jgi:uncharacterized protein YjhX (UPF0386 family)